MKSMNMTCKTGICLVLAGMMLVGCGLSDTPPVSVTIKKSDEGVATTEVAKADGNTGDKPGATVAAGGSADLVGVVLFDGTPPNLPPIIAMGAEVKDKTVCSATAVPDESLVVDPASKGIQNVFVYLEKAPAGATPIPPPEKQIFDQKGCKFIPHAMIVRTKLPLPVLSDDAVGHNTHTNPVRQSGINGAVSANDRVGALKIIYSKSEQNPFSVTCDVHTWMKAYHLPLDHGFAAVTNEKGEFSIKGLPPGTHTLKVWHESGNALERSLKVTIPAKEPLTLKYNAAKFGK